MEKLLSASEILRMNLPGLPKTKPALLARAEKEAWQYESKIGLGGVRKVFLVPRAYLPGNVPLRTENTDLVDPASQSEAKAERIANKALDTFGEKIDGERLAYAIRFLDNYLEEKNIHVDAKRKSEIVVSLYNLMKTSENEADIKNLLKLVA
ncbi:hypothetical protein [Undibacterium sp. WLX3042]|uniref:hypothetical protein n=1 Tax=Undibacterium sp. WLX3042 TaxID=3412686 RepID=UPI003C2D2001